MSSGLVKPKQYDIEDSNIALLGSDLEKNVRLNAAQGEAAWHTAGKETGLEIWRIEKFKVVAWPKENYGEFYAGDSYIILHTYKKKPDDEKFSFDLHFWLGKETSQDEAGTAAYKTVELDDFLGQAPVQHREVQGYESDMFLSYFPQMKVQSGGVDSGFKHVKPEEYRHRLLHVKGAKGRLVVREAEKSYKSMNSGDCFILDAGAEVYIWNGKESSGAERQKAAEYANHLINDRPGEQKIKITTEGDSDESDFWNLLGEKGQVKSAAEAGDDKKAHEGVQKRLLRLSDASGKLEFKEEASGKVTMEMFDTNDVFVFDAGHEVFVWMGKKATSTEKKMGLQYAQDYLNKFKRPAHLPISRVFEGGENEVFKGALDASGGANYKVTKSNSPSKKPLPAKEEPAQPSFANFKLKSTAKPVDFEGPTK